jgi:transcription antitermination factor NusG
MNWYVLVTAPQLEFKAQELVRRMGYQTVLPFVEQELRARYSSRTKAVPEPRFRRHPLLRQYMIVKARGSDQMGELIYLASREPKRLITGYLKHDRYGLAAPINDEQADYLESLSGRQIRNGPQIEPLRIGDVARIINGYGAGQTAEIMKTKGESAYMLVKVLNSMRLVDVPLHNLERVCQIDEQTGIVQNPLANPPRISLYVDKGRCLSDGQ